MKKQPKIKFLTLIMLLSLILFFLGSLSAVSADQSTIYVNGSFGNDDNDGFSWQTAKLTIKNGTGTVFENGIVNIAPGIYNEHNITIDKNMTINGSGSSSTIVNGTYSDRIFNITSNANVIIANMTITGGKAPNGRSGNPLSGDSGTSGADGGAIYNQGTLMLQNCVIKDNGAGNGGYGGSGDILKSGPGGSGGNGGNGGAIYNTGTLFINQCDISYNHAGNGGSGGDGGWNGAYPSSGGTGGNGGQGGNGGAIYNAGILQIINTSLTNNYAGSGGSGGAGGWGGSVGAYGWHGGDGGSGGSGGSGGAIYNSETLDITSSTLTNNHNGNGGNGGSGGQGGIAANAGTGGNGGQGGNGGNGGAIYNTGTSNIGNSTLNNNYNGNGGNGGSGGTGGHGANAQAGGSGGSGGQGGSGGAIYNQGTSTIQSSTINNNYSGDGGSGGSGGSGGDGADAGTGANGGPGGQGGSGGAVYNSGTLTVTSTTLNSNHNGNGGNGSNGGTGGSGANARHGGDGGSGGSGGSGGAIYNSGILTIQSSTINSNYNGNGGNGGSGGTGGYTPTPFKYAGDGGNGGSGGSGGSGGAVYNQGTLNINSSNINSNHNGNGGNGGSGGSGGSSGKLSHDGHDGIGGRGGDGGSGGAIYNFNGSLTIKSSNILYNNFGSGGSGRISGFGGDGGALSSFSIYNIFVNYNRIIGNMQSEIEADGYGDIKYNWWGSNANPHGNVVTNLKYDPWIVLTITPADTVPYEHILNGQTAGITVDLLHDSNGVYHDPSNGHVPDLPISFINPSWGSYQGTVPTILTNGIAQVTYHANGDLPLPDSVQIPATVDGNTISTHLVVEEDDSVSISVTANGGWPNLNLNVGDTGVFTVTVHNDYDDPVSNVQIKLTVPAGFSVNPPAGTSYDPTSGIWTINSLGPEETISITITKLFNSTDAGNNFICSAEIYSGHQANPPAPATIHVKYAPVVLIKSNSGSGKVNVNETFYYIITIHNPCPDSATNVTLTDVLPEGLEFVNAPGGSYDPATRTVTWTGYNVPAGDYSFYIYVKALNQLAGLNITNNATETQAEYPYQVPAYAVSNNDTVHVKEANLTINNTANGGLQNAQLNVGDTGTFTVTVINTGGDDATNVIVYVDAPIGFTDWNPSLGTYDGHVWNIGDLTVGQSAILTISGIITGDMAGTTITNAANETHAEYPFQALALTAAIYVKKADIQLTNTVDNPRPNVGDTVTFTIKVKNNGPDPATNVVVNDLLPGFNVGTLSKGTYTDGVWTIGTLDIGEEVIMTLVGLITPDMAGKTIINDANETQSEYPQYNATNTSIYVPKSDLYIRTSLSRNKPVVGDIITIKFKLGNRGPDAAENVKITFKIPKGLKYISVKVDQGAVTYDRTTGILTWTLDNVPVGDPYLYLTVKIMKSGTYVIDPAVFSATYNANTQGNPGYIKFKAYKASNKIPMQKTGIPINWLIFAVLMVISGLLMSKRR